MQKAWWHMPRTWHFGVEVRDLEFEIIFSYLRSLKPPDGGGARL